VIEKAEDEEAQDAEEKAQKGVDPHPDTDDEKKQEYCSEAKDPRTIYLDPDSLNYFTGVPTVCFNLLELIPKVCRGY
jgi:hypothetical protein